MSDTPRTDAVHKACMKLGFGSIIVVPENYPPHDPWELARELEKELAETKAKLQQVIQEKSKWHKRFFSLASKFWVEEEAAWRLNFPLTDDQELYYGNLIKAIDASID